MKSKLNRVNTFTAIYSRAVAVIWHSASVLAWRKGVYSVWNLQGISKLKASENISDTEEAILNGVMRGGNSSLRQEKRNLTWKRKSNNEHDWTSLNWICWTKIKLGSLKTLNQYYHAKTNID